MTLADVLDEWRQGREEHIPVCCRARYCLDLLRGREPAMTRPAELRAGVVPCGIVHRCTPREKALWSTYWLVMDEVDGDE